MRRALVVGSAGCVYDDLLRVYQMTVPDAVYVVNAVATWYDGADAWCTLHPEFVARWKAQRTEPHPPVISPPANELGSLPREHVGQIDRFVSYRFDADMRSSGSSGLYAAKVAMDDGFDRVILAGVPMLPEAGHVGGVGPWKDCHAFAAGWHHAVPYIRDRVRSVSGWTEELLGTPTPRWLVEGRSV